MASLAAPRRDIELFASHLVDDTVEQILGANIDDGDRVDAGVTPRTTFFSGAIAPADANGGISNSIQSRISPSSIGIIGRLEPSENAIEITVRVSFALYYRIIPTPEEAEKSSNDVPIVYRKAEVGPVAVDVNLPAGRNNEEHDRLVRDASTALNDVVRDATQSTREDIAADPWLYGGEEEDIAEFIAECGDLDDGAFGDTLAQRTNVGGDRKHVPDPEIDFGVRLLEGANQAQQTATSRGADGTALTRIDISNATSPETDTDFEEADNALYETCLELYPRGSTARVDIEFEQLPDDFRYDPFVPGHGHNCAVKSTPDGDGIQTQTVPTYDQPYFEHSKLDGQANPRFDRLADDPLPVLRAIRDRLWDYRHDGENGWQARLDTELASTTDPDSDETVGAIREGIAEFEDEIERYESGLELLERDNEARELFEQMNETFYEKVKLREPVRSDDDLEYPGWRPFQIVFIVTVLPDIMLEEREFSPKDHNRESVSLVYYPTGGGKTEAYLALLVFSALFDRRRGKSFGATSMMRFPLRLLSLQQFQRVMDVLVYADEIRRQEGYGGDPFGAGYFSGATENKLAELPDIEYGNYPTYPGKEKQLERNQSELRRLADDWENDELSNIEKDDYRMLESCPLCDTPVDVVLNPESARIEHRCPAEDCHREELNVYVLDRDIYRYLPTMILGTQDKLAAIGYEYHFRTIFGHVNYRCPEHGYTHAADDCFETRYCDRDKPYSGDGESMESVTPVDPAPTLTIQDELHLVNEELGTFESHYYAAFEKHFEWAYEMHDWGNIEEYRPPKKVAATATIEEFDNQVQHLYLADGILFPAQGPKYRESFYSRKDPNRRQRTYIGVTPWNRSQINSIVRCLELHQRRLQDMLDDPQEAMEKIGFDELDDEDVFVDLVSHYFTLVNYVISKNEGARVHKSADTQANDNLIAEDYDPIDRFELTGGTDFREIADMLARYDRVGAGLTYEDIYGLVVATSSISHGVDLEALNYMLFFDAPPRMGEYIQASSRVGRRYPGIVLDVLDPIQERDRSHYHFFEKYHEYLDRLVEPVAVNRWAKFSIQRTFPGLFMSILYQRDFALLDEELSYFGNYVGSALFKEAESSGLIDQDRMLADLGEIYGVDWGTGELPFQDRLEELVTKSFNQIMTQAEEKGDDCVIGRKMTSLRDVDEQLEIKPSSDHSDAFRAMGVGRRY